MKTQLFFDKSCYGKDKSNEMPHLWGNIIWGLKFIPKIIWRLNTKDIENIKDLKEKTGFVLVSNHTSFLDVFCIYVCVRLKQWPRFIARDTLFNNKVLGFFLARAGVFPIKRDSADRQAIKRAVKMLKNKEIVAIMPEGTRRSKGSKTPKLHNGAAFIARLAGKVPIVPVSAINIEKVKEKGKGIKFPKVTVKFGNPVMLEDFDFLPKDKRLDACTWYAMREVFAIAQKCEAKDVNMKELFPDCEDFTKVFDENPVPKHTSKEIASRY